MSDKQPRVLFVTFEFDKYIAGGVGRVINGIVPMLREKIDLQILLLLVKKHRVYKMKNGKWSFKRYGRFKLTHLYKILKADTFDVVHIFHISKFTAEIIKMIRESFPKIKIIYSCHSISKYEYDIRNCHPEFLGFEQFILREVDHIHLLNQASFGYLKHSYPEIAAQKAYSIIPNGIDESTFIKKDLRFQRKMSYLKSNKKTTVLCMSRWSRGKGLEILLEAIPKVIKQNNNVQFVIAGRKAKSWEYMYNHFLKEIDQKITALSQYIITLGWLDDQKRNALFSFADIWVMPSLLEYFPFSILEPMIANLPIISSKIDSVQEMLSDNEDCLFYEPMNSEELANKILTLINNPDIRRQIANSAYQKAKKLYRWEDISNKYIQMYQEVLSPELEDEVIKKIG